MGEQSGTVGDVNTALPSARVLTQKGLRAHCLFGSWFAPISSPENLKLAEFGASVGTLNTFAGALEPRRIEVWLPEAISVVGAIIRILAHVEGCGVSLCCELFTFPRPCE